MQVFCESQLTDNPEQMAPQPWEAEFLSSFISFERHP
jgi:hypothetical protein